jgi:hypothetical protein
MRAKSDRRQAFAAVAAAVGERGLAAFARIAVEKSVLPFAADFRWLILAFHKFRFVSAWKTPLTERRRVTVKRLVSRRGSIVNKDVNGKNWLFTARVKFAILS